jgi:hypothetical protein
MRKVMLVLAVFGLVGLLWAADPFVGTWKMNPAKSNSGNPPLNSFTVKFEAEDNGVKVTEDIVEADGKVIHRSFSARYDGKDYPVTAPDADAISVIKPNPDTTEYVGKKAGKEIWSGHAVVSKDGKTYTDTVSGKDANGKAFSYSFFFEKQ